MEHTHTNTTGVSWLFFLAHLPLEDWHHTGLRFPGELTPVTEPFSSQKQLHLYWCQLHLYWCWLSLLLRSCLPYYKHTTCWAMLSQHLYLIQFRRKIIMLALHFGSPGCSRSWPLPSYTWYRVLIIKGSPILHHPTWLHAGYMHVARVLRSNQFSWKLHTTSSIHISHTRHNHVNEDITFAWCHTPMHM